MGDDLDLGLLPDWDLSPENGPTISKSNPLLDIYANRANVSLLEHLENFCAGKMMQFRLLAKPLDFDLPFLICFVEMLKNKPSISLNDAMSEATDAAVWRYYDNENPDRVVHTNE